MDTMFDEFCCSIQLITDLVQELKHLQEQKADTAAKGRHSAMDAILKQEQVFILKLRGLEKNRIRLAEPLGWKDLTFRQILAQAPEDQRARLLPLFTELDSQLKGLLDAKDSAQRMITFRLAEFERLLAGQSLSYDEKGRPVTAAPHSFRDQYV